MRAAVAALAPRVEPGVLVQPLARAVLAALGPPLVQVALALPVAVAQEVPESLAPERVPDQGVLAVAVAVARGESPAVAQAGVESPAAAQLPAQAVLADLADLAARRAVARAVRRAVVARGESGAAAWIATVTKA